jgi:hypothetical protein
VTRSDLLKRLYLGHILREVEDELQRVLVRVRVVVAIRVRLELLAVANDALATLAEGNFDVLARGGAHVVPQRRLNAPDFPTDDVLRAHAPTVLVREVLGTQRARQLPSALPNGAVVVGLPPARCDGPPRHAVQVDGRPIRDVTVLMEDSLQLPSCAGQGASL